MPELTDHVLCPYRLLTEMGGGGMATVYRAYDAHADRLVALKVLLPHLWRDHDFVERFQCEGRNAAALEHPNIIPVYESGLVEGYPYLAMAYVEGGSLAKRLAWQQGPLEADAEGIASTPCSHATAGRSCVSSLNPMSGLIGSVVYRPLGKPTGGVLES